MRSALRKRDSRSTTRLHDAKKKEMNALHLRLAVVSLVVTGAAAGVVACGETSGAADDGASSGMPMRTSDAGGDAGAPDDNGGDTEVAIDGGDDDADAGDAEAGAPALSSKRFDLTQPSYDQFRNKALHEQRVMQGFGFDDQNHRLYVAQLQNGTSGDDLCINELDEAGNLLGTMHLNGAGHGVSIGVEPVGTSSYLWVETDSSNPTDTGRGTALLRFKFENGKVPAGTKFLTGSSTITAAIDPVEKRIAIRRIESGAFHYRVFPLAAAVAGDFTQPLVHFVQPALSTSAVVFQGYTIYGQYLYTLDGTGHDDASAIDSYVTAIDMNTGKVKSRALTRAGASLVFREPEGLAIARTTAGETRLYLGFASRDTLAGSKRFANIFYKNVLVP